MLHSLSQERPLPQRLTVHELLTRVAVTGILSPNGLGSNIELLFLMAMHPTGLSRKYLMLIFEITSIFGGTPLLS